MRAHQVWAAVAVLVFAAFPLAAEEFRHPTGAYTLPLPPGWTAQGDIDPTGGYSS